MIFPQLYIKRAWSLTWRHHGHVAEVQCDLEPRHAVPDSCVGGKVTLRVRTITVIEGGFICMLSTFPSQCNAGFPALQRCRTAPTHPGTTDIDGGAHRTEFSLTFDATYMHIPLFASLVQIVKVKFSLGTGLVTLFLGVLAVSAVMTGYTCASHGSVFLSFGEPELGQWRWIRCM